jgi:hypothetical protein
MNRVLLAINALEGRLALSVSDLPLYRQGQVMTAGDINELLVPTRFLPG